jgi:hypothetical protein
MVWPGSIYNGSGGRYSIVPALLLISAAVVLIDSASRRRQAPGRLAWASAATVAVLAISIVTSFDAREIDVRGVPPWDAALAGAAQECTAQGADDIAVQTSPPGFGIQLRCEEISSFAPSRR